MLRFFGYQLELNVEEVLAGENGPALCTARDANGQPWIIAQVGYDPARLAWLCAPTSDRAAQAVTAHLADPRDVIRHSRTGTVELVRLEDGRPVHDQCLLCSHVPDAFLAAVAVPNGAGRRPTPGSPVRRREPPKVSESASTAPERNSDQGPSAVPAPGTRPLPTSIAHRRLLPCGPGSGFDEPRADAAVGYLAAACRA